MISFAVSVVASFAAFFAGRPILAGKHIDTTRAEPTGSPVTLGP